jgi:hypothetical protein
LRISTLEEELAKASVEQAKRAAEQEWVNEKRVKAAEERVRTAYEKQVRVLQQELTKRTKLSDDMHALQRSGSAEATGAEQERVRAAERRVMRLELELEKAAAERVALVNQLKYLQRDLHELQLEQQRQVWLKLEKHRGGGEEDPLRMVARRTASRAMHSLLARDPDILSDHDATLLDRRIATFLQEELRRAQEKGQPSASGGVSPHTQPVQTGADVNSIRPASDFVDDDDPDTPAGKS